MLANFTFLLLAMTGFYMTYAQSWTFAYRINLLFHPALGLFGMGALFLYIRRRIHEKGAAKKELKKGMYYFARLSGTAAVVVFFLAAGCACFSLKQPFKG